MSMTMETMVEMFGEPISVYTRAQAIKDGVLVDVTEAAKETGFKFPVAVTQVLWSDIKHFPEGHAQSVRGRLNDVLWMLFLAIKQAPADEDTVWFEVLMVVPSGKTEKFELWARVTGEGDGGAPVITVMRTDED